MAQNVCFLCRAKADVHKEFEQETTSLLTVVDCSQCGHYRLAPQAWTNHERACLAAYVTHENQAKRRPPLIHAGNWQTLVRIGETLIEKK